MNTEGVEEEFFNGTHSCSYNYGRISRNTPNSLRPHDTQFPDPFGTADQPGHLIPAVRAKSDKHTVAINRCYDVRQRQAHLHIGVIEE